jgi:hypothetical protein
VGVRVRVLGRWLLMTIAMRMMSSEVVGVVTDLLVRAVV